MTDHDRIREALGHIPADDRDTWVRIGMAVKAELGEDGFDIWDAWSQSTDSYSARDAKDVWRSIRPTGKVTIGTLFHEAKARGWVNGSHSAPSPEEIAQRKRVAEERAAQDEAEIERERAQAATWAKEVWKVAPEARADHPYLVHKQVAPVSTLREIGAGDLAKLLGYAPRSGGELLEGRVLVVPVIHGKRIATLELIDEAGRKTALRGRGTKAGGYWPAQQMPEVDGPEPLAIGEGMATTLSATEATDYLGVAALSASNLLAVAKAMRERYPTRPIVLSADLVKKTGEPDSHAIEAARAVGARLAIPDFGPNRPEGKKDFNDLSQLRGAEAVRQAIEGAQVLPTAEVAAEPRERAEEQPDAEKGERQGQASAIVAFVQEHAELFHDENRDVFATDKATGETRRLDSRQFRDWISAGFYGATGKAARDQSIREAISTLAGLGRFQGECRPVFVRVAQHADSYYLDLGEHGKSRAIRIDAGKWEIVDSPPVRFLRPETLRPLPEPESGGDMATLWIVANVPENARLLVLAWLCECLRPDTPFPVLELLGEHGSAKSTTQIALRRLIDPNASDLRAAPKNVEDIFVGAGSSWIVSYENISHLSAPAQDALCVLATGGGFATRKFYTNTEESVIVVKRPIVLNGIAAAVTAQDLVDRTVSVETPLIEERKETAELWRLFDREHGRLLGALLDVVAAALGRLPGTHLPAAFRPRLIEFARLGMAVAEAVGKAGENFMKEFNASRAEIIARTIDASPVASALIEWFEARGNFEVVLPVKDLMEMVEKFRPANTDAWPRSPKGFGDALRRAAPALRTLGIECRCEGKTGGSVRWKISARVPVESSPASPECPNAETQSRTCRTFRTSSDPESRDDRSARYV